MQKQVLTQLITLHTHGICPRTKNKRLACKQSAGEKAPGRLLHLFEYSSETSGKKVDGFFFFFLKMMDEDTRRWEGEISVQEQSQAMRRMTIKN